MSCSGHSLPRPLAFRENTIAGRPLKVLQLALITSLIYLLPLRSDAAELAIVIDDMGYNLSRAERVLDMPVELTLGLLPFAPHAQSIAAAATQAGREIILHQPMEPLKPRWTEPGTLQLAMSADRFDREFSASLARLPRATGVSNHTGSLLTAQRVPMDWLMASIAKRGLFFLDSRTTPNTVAESTARDWQVPAIRRDVFLDHVQTAEFMNAAFQRGLQIARRKGHAVIIAHPHRRTLEFLEARLGALPGDIHLITLSQLVGDGRAAATAKIKKSGEFKPPDRTTLALHGTPESPSISPGQ